MVPLCRAEKRELVSFPDTLVSAAGIQPVKNLARLRSPCAKTSVKSYFWVALSLLACLVTIQKPDFEGKN